MSEVKVPKWKGRVTADGNLKIYRRDGFMQYLRNFIEKDIEVVVKKPTKDRSPQEHKYYWGVVVSMVAEEMGVMPEEAHEMMKDILLKRLHRGVTESGKPYAYMRVPSITEMNDTSFREYWQSCQRWAALPTDPEKGLGISSGLGLYIPDPNEVDYEDY